MSMPPKDQTRQAFEDIPADMTGVAEDVEREHRRRCLVCRRRHAHNLNLYVFPDRNDLGFSQPRRVCTLATGTSDV